MRFATLLGVVTVVAAADELWKDPSQSVEARVAALLPKLSVEELANQLRAPDFGVTVESVIKDYGKTSIGTISAFALADIKTVQEAVLNQSRWGIPVAWLHESLHSGCYGGTIFPMPLTLGATFNTTLIEAVHDIIANETLICGATIAFAPVINLFTDPRFGRFQEGFSPDPSLTAHYAEASAKGLQGAKTLRHNSGGYLPAGKVLALAKHYVGYGGAEGGLNGKRLDATEREVRDVYLKPWRYFATVGGGMGAMPSHQTVLDVPMHANDYLVNTVLRKELNFTDGLTISDCNDINVLIQFRVASTPAQAAARGIIGGVDQDLQCGQFTYTYENINDALTQGLITMEQLRTTVGRVLKMKFATGLFDNPYPDQNGRAYLDTAAKRQLALEAAQQGTVLLRNQNTALPLKDLNAKTIVSLGWLGSADAAGSFVGPYSSMGAEIKTIQGVLSAGWKGTKLAYSQGATPDANANETQIAAAVALASSVPCADLGAIILTLGDSEKTCGEWMDRSDLDLPGGQEALLNAILSAKSAGKICQSTPIIGVLISGRPVSFSIQSNGVNLLNGMDALLWAGRPGEEGAQAILDVIAGDVTPSARLQASWAKTVGHVHSGAQPFQQPLVGKWVSNQRSPPDASGRVYNSYVSDPYGEAAPLFPFGFGLSYTTFKYDQLVVGAAAVPVITDGSEVVVTVQFSVQNNGTVHSGAEAAQVYVQDPEGSLVVRPWKRLASFVLTRVLLPGEHQSMQVALTYNDLALSTEASPSAREVQKGAWVVRVGGSSDADLLVGGFTI